MQARCTTNELGQTDLNAGDRQCLVEKEVLIKNGRVRRQRAVIRACLVLLTGGIKIRESLDRIVRDGCQAARKVRKLSVSVRKSKD
jgi:hypothetical protein